MKIRVILFKQRKHLFKQQYQTGPHSLYKCSSYQIHQSANLSSLSSKQHLGIKLPHPHEPSLVCYFAPKLFHH